MNEVLGDEQCCAIASGSLKLTQKPHSVRMIKFVDESLPVVQPSSEVKAPGTAVAGESVAFEAVSSSPESPVVAYRWDFGDGTSADGAKAHHAYTRSGHYAVTLVLTGLNALQARKTIDVSVTGEIPTRFEPSRKKRATAPLETAR